MSTRETITPNGTEQTTKLATFSPIVTMVTAEIDDGYTFIVADGAPNAMFSTPNILRITWIDDNNEDTCTVAYADTFDNAVIFIRCLLSSDIEPLFERPGHYTITKLSGSEAYKTISMIKRLIKKGTSQTHSRTDDIHIYTNAFSGTIDPYSSEQ